MGLFSRSKKSEKGEPLDKITQQMSDAANGCIEHYKSRYRTSLDYSEHSLKIIDQLLGDASRLYPKMPENQKKWLIGSVGAYIFEVARKKYSGKYFWSEENNQPVLVTGLPDFAISLITYDKVHGRLVNGKDDNIPDFFQGYVEHVKNGKPGDKATIV